MLLMLMWNNVLLSRSLLERFNVCWEYVKNNVHLGNREGGSCCLRNSGLRVCTICGDIALTSSLLPLLPLVVSCLPPSPRPLTPCHRYDPLDRLWAKLPMVGRWGIANAYRHRSPGEQHVDVLKFDNSPRPRSLQSAVLLGVQGTPSSERGIETPRIIMFGGYDGSNYLDDIWELQLDHLNKTEGAMVDERRDAQCTWRMQKGSLANTFWVDSCASTGSGAGQFQECDIREIMVRAWCLNELQSFSNY